MSVLQTVTQPKTNMWPVNVGPSCLLEWVIIVWRPADNTPFHVRDTGWYGPQNQWASSNRSSINNVHPDILAKKIIVR